MRRYTCFVPLAALLLLLACETSGDDGRPFAEDTGGGTPDVTLNDGAGGDASVDTASDALDVLTDCVSSCEGRACGDDGCGGSCGACGDGEACQEGACVVCDPQCEGRICGDDGCGGSCGACPPGEACTTQGACVPCEIDCEDKVCGPDGCGGSCGACPPGGTCNDWGQCVGGCEPECLGRECGPDACGGSCGACADGELCTDLGHCVEAPDCGAVTKIGCCDGEVLWACVGGEVQDEPCAEPACGWDAGEGGYACGTDGEASPDGAFPIDCPWVCHPDCEGQGCGPDGCGGLCGACDLGAVCTSSGACCAPDCEGKTCGGDGCGGSCGACDPGQVCGPMFECVDPCGAGCEGKDCGDDGCGGSCGVCAPGLTCTDFGHCVEQCVVHCDGKSCGPDGCGGACAPGCPPGLFCDGDGLCVETCAPDCEDRVCGPDGCGGSCGDCDGDIACTIDGRCGTECLSCGFDPGCLELGFEGGNLVGWELVGDATVLSALGATEAPAGQKMLYLSNSQETDGRVTFQACVPAGTSSLHFLWRFYSEEFKEFCGSTYQDFLRVTVAVSPGGIPQAVFMRTIDVLCPPADCGGCGTQYVGLTAADVAFDQGDVWHTGWQVANVSIASMTAGDEPVTLTLSFEAGDEGDSIYVSTALIDDIRLLGDCEPDCSAGDCIEDGCGGLCGACEPGVGCEYGWCGGPCEPSCAGKECGPDGCSGTCGECPPDESCNTLGQCAQGCQPACQGKECGADGCGGTCGTCSLFEVCTDAGQCSNCIAQCGDKVCGDDGCGGSCGACEEGQICSQGACLDGFGIPCQFLEDCPEGFICPDDIFSMGVCTVACDPSTGAGCPEGWTCFPNLFGDPPGYCTDQSMPSP